MTALDHLLYALLWASFGLGHSALAGVGGRHLLAPLVGRWQRLAYNLIAVAHLAVVLVVGRLVLASAVEPFARPTALAVLQAAMLLGGLWLLWGGGRRYDLARFLGTAPETPGTAPEPLVTDGLRARVRHPLYAGAHLLLWGLVADPLGLATAVWGSAYLVVGTWLEERRLLRVYGDAYADYRRRVPGLLPRLRR